MTGDEATRIIKSEMCKRCGVYLGGGECHNNCRVIQCIEALSAESCEDKEYKKDLNELKEQILKEGDTLVSKRDLLERFVKIDNEYEHSPWNLLQICNNFNILIGEKPRTDVISRQAVKEFVEYIQTIKDKHNDEGSPINYGTICDLVIRGWKLVESER